MSAEIYYFTGTGNSLYMARDIAEVLKGDLIPIASTINKEAIDSDADSIGIVFPVYYEDAPVIIKKFVRKLKHLKDKYIFAVCCYGGAAGVTLRTVKGLVSEKGGRNFAGYGVHMPQNSFYKPRENHEALYAKWKKKRDKIARNTKKHTTGLFYSNPAIEMMIALVYKIMIEPACRVALAEMTGASTDLPVDKLIGLSGTTYAINNKCTGCGLCVDVCPVENITMMDDRPVWQQHCESCLACYNWCPMGAIEGGITKKDYYYRHPAFKADDIMRQKEIFIS